MQIKSTASLAFINLSPDRKTPIGTDIINGVTANSDTFPNLPVKTGELTDLNASLTDAAARARTGDHTASAALLNIVKKWDNAFRSTAKYVGTIANGNEEIIRLGGCTPTKNQTNPSQLPEGSQHVDVTAGKGGTVTIGCDADTSVKAYLYVAATAGATIKQDGNTLVIQTPTETIYVQADTHRSVMLHNLKSGVPLNVSMMPLNSVGCGPLSSPQTVISQP